MSSLTPADFDLEANPPTARVEAAYSKNRKEAVQPPPPDVAETLRAYLAGKPADCPVWLGKRDTGVSASFPLWGREV